MVKILYLEDEANIRDVILEYLKMKDYDVAVAVDGSEALKLLETEKFDLAILDIMVPFVSGLEVLEHITTTYPETKTIMLTALGDESSQLEAFNHYADDYIIKPFSPIILLKRIEAVLRRGLAHPEATKTADNQGIIIQDESYQVFYQQQSLNLTVTEFVIFKELAGHPQKVFSRAELLDVIDPDNLIVSDRVIDAHIKNLRKKLPTDLIKTIIGIGYQYQSQEGLR